MTGPQNMFDESNHTKRVQIFGGGRKSFFIDDLLCLIEQQGIALEEL